MFKKQKFEEEFMEILEKSIEEELERKKNMTIEDRVAEQEAAQSLLVAKTTLFHIHELELPKTEKYFKVITKLFDSHAAINKETLEKLLAMLKEEKDAQSKQENL